MKNNFLQIPSKPGVVQEKTISHTQDEARSVGLAKACVFQNIYSVIEKLDPRIQLKQNEKCTCLHSYSCLFTLALCYCLA